MGLRKDKGKTTSSTHPRSVYRGDTTFSSGLLARHTPIMDEILVESEDIRLADARQRY
jgi:hypothetical protein